MDLSLPIYFSVWSQGNYVDVENFRSQFQNHIRQAGVKEFCWKSLRGLIN